MDSVTNPYTPSAGRRPPELAGRDGEIDEMRVLVARAKAGMAGRAMVLHGLRGVGKTVLLRELHAVAHDAGWLTVEIEGSRLSGAKARARATLARDLVASARRLQGRVKAVAGSVGTALAAIGAFSFKLGYTGVELAVTRAQGRADSGDLGLDLDELVEDLAGVLREQGIGAAVFVDEMQDLDAEMLGALLTAQHRAAQREIPFYVIGAGLPNLPGVLADSNSYAERQFDYRHITALGPTDAMQALTAPAAARGVAYEPSAVARLVAASDGYPYFIQVYGDQAWRLAPGPTTITDIDAQEAQAAGTASLDDGFFSSRWERATDAERRFMRAMAEDRGPSTSSTVMARIGLPETSPGTYRGGLIRKGLIYSPDRGQVAFTVPHMAEFIARHADVD